jgi:glycogen debranching enzyme
MLTGAIALKEDRLQFITNETGDTTAENPGLGMYFQDTRFLNRYELTVNGTKPLFLSSSTNKHYIATFQFINPPLVLANGQRVGQQTVSIRRSRFVTGDGLYERIGFLNCNPFEIELDVVLAIDADFRDIFAVRGYRTQRVVGQISVTLGGEDVVFSYRGRDGLHRSTVVSFSRAPEAISSHEMRFCVKLQPQERESIIVRVHPRIGRTHKKLSDDFDGELERLSVSYREWDQRSTQISTNNELFDREILRASRYDIRGLLERTKQGVVPDAGVPWYAVPFGRDAIITSLQTLIYNPEIAEGTLRYLAAHQGKKVDEYTEEQPGKIMHELRRGELARLAEVPHTPYYGTVDATPLFLVLFCEAMEWRGSEKLYRDILPTAMKALEWIDAYGDRDGDGYVEYVGQRAGGVINQGWKDSANSVQHADGTNAPQPIALVEVQGYVYAAKMGLARQLRLRGDPTASKLEAEAQDLKQRFNRDFWMEDQSFFALALDRDKRQVPSVTSNAGHCLWSGICEPEKAAAVAARLMADDMFSGWGIRTLSNRSPNYNPMSYHNGSVWPHDTALVALGLRRIGDTEGANRVVTGLIEAGFRFPDGRLPELFCGFARDQRFNSSPTAYVVSCSPQAWAAGCVFMLLHCILDARADLAGGRLRVAPRLPDLFHRIRLDNLSVGSETVDLLLERRGNETSVEMSGGSKLHLDTMLP